MKKWYYWIIYLVLALKFVEYWNRRNGVKAVSEIRYLKEYSQYVLLYGLYKGYSMTNF